jgi:predicted esterase
MGGYGVYRTLYEDPGRYAAAAVFSGLPVVDSEYAGASTPPDFRRLENLTPLRGKNIVVIHGGRDRNCPVELTVDLVSLMTRAGIPVLFLLDKDAGHEPPRDPAIQAQYRNWVEAAVREEPHRFPSKQP